MKIAYSRQALADLDAIATYCSANASPATGHRHESEIGET
jgi:plasmid stabilization system protein ParE